MSSINSCPICLQSSTLSPDLFGVHYECGNCKIQIPKIAPKSGVVTNQVATPPTEKLNMLIRRQIKVCGIEPSTHNLLDFGCGNGKFLKAVIGKRLFSGFVQGIELDEDSYLAARRAGVEVRKDLPLNLENTIVTMWHVAEHLDPSDLKSLFLKFENLQVSKIIIVVPNGQSRAWKNYGAGFAFYDPESHLVQYSPESLQRLLDSSNLEIVSNHRILPYGIFCSIQTLLNNRFERNYLYNQMKRDGAKVSLYSLLKMGVYLCLNIVDLTKLLVAEFRISDASVIAVTAKSKAAAK